MNKYFTFLFLLIAFTQSANGWNSIRFNKENKTYVINKEYDLAGKSITIPKGCTLKFQGGVLKNGTLIGDRTSIEAGYGQQIFDFNIQVCGSWLISAWKPEWFGAKSEPGLMDTQALQCALDAARDTDIKIVQLQGRTYYTDATLNVYPYTTLIGSDKTASWLFATQITPIKKVDAIRITAIDSDVRSTGVTIRNLIIRNGSGENYSMAGILMRKDSLRFGVDKLRLENVQVLYFEYGIKADLYGVSPFANCCFRNVECTHNNIGLCVEGHFEGDSNENKIWMNVNRFELCRFSENRIGGIFVNNVWMLLNNVFDQCTIEENGKDYSLPLYNQFGVFGAKFANKYTPSTGGNIFQNCYFEGNYPERKGDTVNIKEYRYRESIFPTGFIENKMNGNVVLQQYSFCFFNCVSSRNKSFVILNDNSHASIIGTIVYDLGKTSEVDTKSYFIEFNDAYVPSSVNSENNIFKVSNNNSLQYFHFITTPHGSGSKYSIIKDDVFDGGKVQLNNMSVKQLLR